MGTLLDFSKLSQVVSIWICEINMAESFFSSSGEHLLNGTDYHMDRWNDNEWHFASSCLKKKTQKNQKTCCSLISPSLNGGRALNLRVTFFCQKSVTLSIFSSFWKSISNVAFFYLRPFLPSALTSVYFWFSAWTYGRVSFIHLPVHKPCLDFLVSSFLSTFYSSSPVPISILSSC